jgi:uncharacterized protein (DUF1684 family)
LTHADHPTRGELPARDPLQLADWRRRVAELYTKVRELALADPARAWDRWLATREELYRAHPQSPVPVDARPAFRARAWPYDPAWRFDVPVARREAGGGAPPLGSTGWDSPLRLPMSSGDALAFEAAGDVELPLATGSRTLTVYWMSGYAGGLFLPFRDATNGTETYGAGRYLLDTAKGADLGGAVADGRLILDFNFAFHPSCAFDARWSCPLAPPENRLDLAVRAGERIA